MATPSTPGLRWATAACGHTRHPAADTQSAALGEHLHHCRTRADRLVSRPTVWAHGIDAPPRRPRLATLLARATRLIR